MREHEGSSGGPDPGNAADYSGMRREVNDAQAPGVTATRWEDHSFLAATFRGASSDALKMSTAFR